MKVCPHLRVALQCVILPCLAFNTTRGDDLRVASWNMVNRPNNQSQDATLATIAEAMGKLDILAMVETDAHSANRTTEIFNQVFPEANFQTVFTTGQIGGERTGFVYDSATVELVGAREMVDGLAHPILRGDFLVDGFSLSMYAIQLQPGAAASDQSMRADEAKLLRADASSLADTHIIYGGDFNWQSSTEDAWDQLTREGSGQGFDAFDVVLNSGVGEWRDNPEFLHLHSQDPRADALEGGELVRRMDDRFDMQLVNEKLFDERGLELVQGSYRVFGNNGTHELHRSITTGTGASRKVLEALANFSHHLPVITDYRWFLEGDLDQNDEVGFTDFLILSSNFGGEQKNASDGDIDGDTLVDFADFLLLTENYGASRGAPSQTVPEPSGILLATIMVVGICIRGGRRACS